ncbi:MAG: helix-turn-helix domain-containing protein [Clostridiales bacterium]|nr:helix-turn-helix domain-containing protein [Clostridiales bacterium]
MKIEQKESFGKYLRAKRLEAGLTQKAFAEQLFVTESAVSKWERGLSYPDITLISTMCTLLNISEHELLAAGEDVEARRNEKLARRYLTLVNRVRTLQYFLYGVPLLVCFICNLAVGHALSWFFIVLAAELTAASLTLLPVFAEKNRGLITLAGFTVSLLLLLLVCCLYTGGSGCFVAAAGVLLGLSLLLAPYVLRRVRLPVPCQEHKALIYFGVNTALLVLLMLVSDLYVQGGVFLRNMCPIAAYCLALPWGMMLILRYTQLNPFLKPAGCLGLSALFYYLLYGVIDWILGIRPYRFGFTYSLREWSQMDLDGRMILTISFVLTGLAVLFLLAGIGYELLRARKQNAAS